MANHLTDCLANRAVRHTNRGERGVAMFFALFALLLLSAIAAALIFSSATDTAINDNYRSEEVAYYGAKSGVEEVRDRMMASNPNTSIPVTYPALLPTTATSPQLYVLNEGNQAGTVKPWVAGNAYFDDELCHDGYPYAGITSVSANLRCTTLPTAPGWYSTIASTAPWNGTKAALSYKWVRLGLKLDGSVQNYIADNNAANAGNLVCWNGVTEEVIPTAKPQTAASCTTAFASPANPVYLVTALGIAPNGARKVVQAEISLGPSTPFPYGLYATSNACPAIAFSGNNASTDSYTTALGGTYATTKTNTGGDVGSNGGVSVGNGNIGGIVGALQPPPVGNGTCVTPVSVGPNGSMVGTVACPSGNAAACYLPTPTTFPVPPAPNPATPNTAYNGSLSIVPGTYGNISLNGNKTLTLAPGVYNINSISMAGNGQITVSPAGAVTLNIGGTGQASPLSIAGNGITDDTKASDFVINYAGSGSVNIAGNGNITAVLDAPNATASQVGNGNWYGAILVSSMSITGNAFFHYDRNVALATQSSSYYTMISYRELSY